MERQELIPTVQMYRLRLRNNRLKFKTSEKIYAIFLTSVKKNRKITTCNRLDLKSNQFHFHSETMCIIKQCVHSCEL